MSWAVGFDEKWNRDIGYGVPAECDHPKCDKQIDRGLSYVCGSEPYGGEHGCGLYFCAEHLFLRQPRASETHVWNCLRCLSYKPPYKPKPDVQEWIDHKMTDESWAAWRESFTTATRKQAAD